MSKLPLQGLEDSLLGGESIASISELQSEHARLLAVRYGVQFSQIPGLRRVDSVHGTELETRLAPPDVMAIAAQVFAVKAMMYYELSARERGFRLVVSGLEASLQPYCHVASIGPSASDRALATTFAKIYERKAEAAPR